MVQSREVHWNFRGSARDSLAGRPSSHEKHLENFFSISSLSVLATCLGDLLATCVGSEKRVFCISKTVFKTFSVFFPLNFCDCSLSSQFLSQLSPSQTLRAPIPKLHCCIFSTQNLQVTGMGFYSWTPFYLILCFFPLIIRICLCFWDGFVFRLLLYVHA